MKCAYIVPSLLNKGPIIVVYEIVKGLIKLNHECVVFYFDKKTELNFPCVTKKISMMDNISLCEYDIVHSHGFRPDMYVFIHKPFINTHTRFISTIHSIIQKDLASEYNSFVSIVFGNIWMWLLYRHDIKVVLSKTSMNYYAHWIRKSKLRYVYNTRSIDYVLPEEKSVSNRLLEFKKKCTYMLGINAMLSPIKGIDIALQALPFLDNVKLVIIGDGKSKDELQQMVITLGVSEKVLFLGYQKNAYRYLPFYDLYLMPSRSEGFPLALLEAVAMRKNVVVSDIPIFEEIFTNDEVTFFKTDNVLSLVEAIKSACKNDKSEAAYNRYLKDYSPNHFIQEYIKVYQDY